MTTYGYIRTSRQRIQGTAGSDPGSPSPGPGAGCRQRRNEAQFPLTRLVWTENQPPDFILYWSWWRRRHLARAQKCHYKRRLYDLRL